MSKSWADIVEDEEDLERRLREISALRSPGKRCYAVTKRGKQCKKPANINSETCHLHIKQCANFRKTFKDQCDALWYAKCNDELTNTQIRDLLDEFEYCEKSRRAYTENCIEPSCRDGKHIGAIVKMEKGRKKCRNILDKRIRSS